MAVAYRGVTAYSEESGDDGQTRYTLGHRLWADAPPNQTTVAAMRAALAAEGFLQGEPSPVDDGALCTKIGARIARKLKTTDGWRWEWSAETAFSSRLRKDAPPTSNKNPLLRPPSIRVSTIKFEAPADRDVDTGEPIVNSAGAPFVRQRKRGRVVFRIKKNFATINWPLLGDWESGGLLYTRNLAEWTPGGPYTAILGAAAAAPGTAWMTELEAEIVFDQGSAFIAVSAEIQYDVGEFKDVLLDQGNYWLDDDGNRRTFLVDGHFATTPQFLDGAGGRLADGDPPEVLPFQYYHAADWSVLPLP